MQDYPTGLDRFDILRQSFYILRHRAKQDVGVSTGASDGAPVNDLPLVRSAAAAGFAKTAREVGIDPYAMVARVRLPAECLTAPDLPIPLDAFIELLEISARESGCSDFGLRTAIARGFPDLGRVSLLMREAETVEAALRTMVTRVSLHSGGMALTVDTRFDAPSISVRLTSRHVQRTQTVQYAVCGLVQNLRWLVGDDWAPEMVCFEHPAPADLRLHRSFFRSAVRHDEIISGLIVSPDFLARRLNASPPALRHQFRRYIQPTMAEDAPGFAPTVTRVIAHCLADGRCRSDEVARILGIDRRTLIRKLDHEGQTYSDLLNQARIEAVQHHLESTRHSLTDAVEIAGFGSLSAFSRWFRTNFGCTATQWRGRL